MQRRLGNEQVLPSKCASKLPPVTTKLGRSQQNPLAYHTLHNGNKSDQYIIFHVGIMTATSATTMPFRLVIAPLGTSMTSQKRRDALIENQYDLGVGRGNPLENR